MLGRLNTSKLIKCLSHRTFEMPANDKTSADTAAFLSASPWSGDSCSAPPASRRNRVLLASRPEGVVAIGSEALFAAIGNWHGTEL